MCPALAINGVPFLTAANVFASASSCTNAGSLQIRADFAIDLSMLVIILELDYIALPSINAMIYVVMMFSLS